MENTMASATETTENLNSQESASVEVQDSTSEIVESNFDVLKAFLREQPHNIRILEEIDQTHQIIVNGIPQVSKLFKLNCPECGCTVNVLQHPQLQTKEQAIRVCLENKENFSQNISYCPKCGQKLGYEPEDLVISEQ